MKISIERIVIEGVTADRSRAETLRREIVRELQLTLQKGKIPAESRDAALIRTGPIEMTTERDLPHEIATRVSNVLEGSQ